MTPTTPSAEALAAELMALADEYAEASAADARHYAPGRKAAARVNLQVEIARLASLEAEPKAQAQAGGVATSVGTALELAYKAAKFYHAWWSNEPNNDAPNAWKLSPAYAELEAHLVRMGTTIDSARTPSPEAREPEPYGWILSNGLQGGAWNRGPQCPPGWRDIPGAKPFYLDAPVPPEQPSMPECWSVVVGDGSRALVSIGHNWLAGKSDLTDQDEQTIIGAAKHLLSFVGYGLPSSAFAPEARETAEPKFATDRSFGWCPDQCPITRLPFFMWIQHPRDGWVPTYGGPLDSYTIPVMGGLPTEPFHERPLERERFDHDAGYWVAGVEEIPLRVAHDDALAAPVSQAEPSTSHEEKGQG